MRYTQESNNRAGGRFASGVSLLICALVAVGLSACSTGNGGGAATANFLPTNTAPAAISTGVATTARPAAAAAVAPATVTPLTPAAAQPPAPVQTKATPRVVRAGGALGVVTTNLQHRNRPEELQAAARLLKSDPGRTPEFILCQEVVFGRSDEQAPNTAAIIANTLGYHWRGTKRTTDHEGVAIVSKYPFVYYAARHLDAQTSRVLLGFRRVSVMGEFMVPSVGRVRVVDVHFTNWEFEKRIRGKQLAETLEWIAEREREMPAEVTILGGDFNAETDWDEMQQIKHPTGGQLAFSDYNSHEYSKGSVGNYEDSRIDLIFVHTRQQVARLADQKVLWRSGLYKSNGSHFFLSDHLPVYHLYSFAPAAVAAGPAVPAPARNPEAVTWIEP